MPREKITSIRRKEITRDWSGCFPEFEAYKPMHLVRRNGPFLCGIYLEVPSGNWDYRVFFHVHNLMIEFPAISLCANMSVRNSKGVTDGFSSLRHSNEFGEAAKKLRDQCILLQKNTVSTDDLVNYLENISVAPVWNQECNNAWGDYVYRDIVLAHFWCGNKEKAESRLLKFKRSLKEWPPTVLNGFGGVEEWEKSLRKLMDHSQLQKTVQSELERHALERYTDYGFICGCDSAT